MQSSNILCLICKNKASVYFCPCETPEATFCRDCMGAHTEKNQELKHKFRKINLLPYYTIPGYLSRYKTREKALPKLKETAISTFGEVDKAIEMYKEAMEQFIVEYTTKVDQKVMVLQQLIKQLTTNTKNTVHNLKAQKEAGIAQLKDIKESLTKEINEALEEVERTLIEHEPQLVSRYGSSFRELTENMEHFKLFSFHVKPSGPFELPYFIDPDSKQILHPAYQSYQAQQEAANMPYDSLQSFPVLQQGFQGQMPQKTAVVDALMQYMVEPSQFLAGRDLSIPIALKTKIYSPQDLLCSTLYAGILGHRIQIYDVDLQKSTNHELPFSFETGVSYVEMKKNTLICLGPSTAVYSLHLISFQRNLLPLLAQPRSYAGVAKTDSFVYAFGGSNAGVALKSCEKYNLKDRNWQALGNMLFPRHSFTPCIFNDLIYLANSTHISFYFSIAMERFDPKTEHFQQLSVS